MPEQQPIEAESELVDRARGGDRAALGQLVEPLRKPLLSYIYRMVTQRDDAEELLQDVLVRLLESLPGYRGESRFKTWLFGIATHVCLDHLRKRKRWRVEAQLIGEQQAIEDPAQLDRLSAVMSRPDFVFEIREHIAFCFSCISRSLPPEQQAAVMLKEVFGFTAQEAAAMMGISEPVFRHRLRAARSVMIESYDGLCQLINKTGVCHQCRSLRDFAPEVNRGPDLVQIQPVHPAIDREALFDARLEFVRSATPGEGPMRTLHDWFFEGIADREESAN